jgi:hypothetical protein
MHELVGEQLHSLEAATVALRRSLEARVTPPPAPAAAAAAPRSKRVSRRRLLLGGGAAAAGATGALVAAGPSPAGSAVAQAATPASSVSVTPTGAIQSTNAQAALAELDTEKAPRANAGFTGSTTLYTAQTQLRPYIDVRAFGAKGDGTTDDTSALVFALFVAAAHAGGTVLLPPGRYRFTGELTVPNGVDVWGCGGHQQTGDLTGTVLQAADASSRVVIEGTGGQSGNFIIDGAHRAAPASGLLYIDAVERIFTALRVSGSGTDGLVLDRAQNCTFNQLLVGDCVRDGLVLDHGAGNNAFIRCEFGSCGRDNIRIRVTEDSSAPFDGTPTGNYFVHCISERGRWQNGGWNGPNNSMLNATGGTLNRFSECVFALSRPNTSTSGRLVLISGGSVVFESCEFSSDFVGGLWNVGAGVEFHGVNYFNCAATAIQWDNFVTNAWGRVFGRCDFASTVATRWAGTGNHRQVSFETDRPLYERLEPDAVFAMRVQRRDEADGFRFQLGTDGALQVGDGTGYTPLATWRLQADGRGWETPDDVHLDGGTLALQEVSGTPAVPAGGNRAALYVKADKLVVAFNDAGTVRYKWLPLAGAGAVWTDSTTPP